jgi:hypothetical protein
MMLSTRRSVPAPRIQEMRDALSHDPPYAGEMIQKQDATLTAGSALRGLPNGLAITCSADGTTGTRPVGRQPCDVQLVFAIANHEQGRPYEKEHQAVRCIAELGGYVRKLPMASMPSSDIRRTSVVIGYPEVLNSLTTTDPTSLISGELSATT